MFQNKFGEHKNVECGLVMVKGGVSNDASTLPIPLQSVNIVASVVHAVAQVELTQVYVNKEDQPIQAIYYFPVDSNGGVTHFHAELEGRTIKGVVKPHETAKEEYEKAISEEKTAFLIEANKPDIFKVRVGFLKPGSQVKIVIGYVTEVKNEKGTNAIRFFIPTTVAPRYISPDENDEKSNDLKNMVFSKETPAPLSLTVNVAIQGKIKTIESPTHKTQIVKKNEVATKGNWTRTVVTLHGQVTDMDRDFVLLICPEDVHVPRLYSEELQSSTSTALMTHLIPSFKLDDQKVELLFVLDRSWSMEGSSIELARKALNLFLHSLPVDCYFNIIGFGSTFEFLFPESVKYDDRSLDEAIQHARSVFANLGGTEILAPLKEIFSKSLKSGYARQLFVLTDGVVSDTDRVIGICKANKRNSRVFALGIGDGASHHLVEGMAEAGGGTAAFATYNESIDSKVLDQLKNAIQPSLTDVRLEWTGPFKFDASAPLVAINKLKTLLGYGKPLPPPSVEIFWEVPENIPPIFDGSQMVVFGVFTGGKVPTGVKIVAKSPDGPLLIKMQLSEENDIGSTDMVHKLAAIKAIRELEFKVSGLIYESSDEEEAKLKAKIESIACQHGLASKYTSFVAVDEGNDRFENNWVMQTRYVPSQVTHGYGANSSPSSPTMLYGYGMAKRCCATYSRHLSLSDPVFELVSDECYDYDDKLNGSQESVLTPSQPSVKRTQKDILHALVATQSFNGSFRMNEEFSDAVGISLDDILGEARRNGWSEETWATAIALAYLNKELIGLKDSWELVENKARKWLENNSKEEMESLILVAENFLQIP